MQPYNITFDDQLPIISVTYGDSYIVAEHNEPLMRDVTAALDDQTEPSFVIFDVRPIKLGLDDLSIGANKATAGAGAFMNHTNLAGTILISDSTLISLAAKGLNSPVFGNKHVDVVPSYEDAIALVQQHI